MRPAGFPPVFQHDVSQGFEAIIVRLVVNVRVDVAVLLLLPACLVVSAGIFVVDVYGVLSSTAAVCDPCDSAISLLSVM